MSAMSTVTPVTISITPHGMRWMARASSTARSRMSAADTSSAIIPVSKPKPATLAMSTAMPAAVSQCARSNGGTASSAAARAAPRRNRRQPPSTRKPAMPTKACASAL